LVCGCCGGPYALRGQDRYACSNHVMNGSCSNSRSITRAALETRMLEGLRAPLMAPGIAAEAMRVYAEETNRLNRERRAGGESDRKALADVEKRLKEIVTVIEDGGYSRPLMMRLRELEAKQADGAVVARPGGHPGPSSERRRHPPSQGGAARRGASAPAGARRAGRSHRALIDHITLTPGPRRGEIAAT
jgi:site-specific DNA recombinase